jgi:carboxypeptidase family protein/TonB-dependent receptor-like protein
MRRVLWCGCLLLILTVSGVPAAYAQATASISGVVRDSAGGVVPGVTVTVKVEGSGQSQEATTDGEGRYTIAALPAGTYTVTASLAGFKTAEAKGVQLAIGQPLNIPLTLEVGKLEEVLTVKSSSELINTETATVTATLNSDQITRMPTPTRNALNAVAFLPGVNTAGTNRDSTINGLPEGFLSITLDGVSNNDNFLRNTDGFFASVTPRQDAVEAVSVVLSTGGANVSAGAGAVTMAFQTRSGSNRFTGSAYEYHRNPRFNSNYIFNQYNHQGKNQVKVNTFGARAGGPVVIPGLYDGRDKAFYFVHYEQVRFPNSFTRTRTVFNPRVYDGWFRYQFGSEVREVNLLDLARANGQVSTIDPTMKNIMAMIDAATKTTGTRTASNDPLYDTYVWQSPAELFEHQPTIRLDYNLTQKHRLSGSWQQITAKRTPDYLNSADPRFPGSPNQRDFKSIRPLISVSMRSVLSQNLTSELRGGATAYGVGSTFGQPAAVKSRNDPSSFADQGGFAIVTPTSTTDWHTSNTPSWRNSPTYSLDENVTWLKGSHSWSFGGNLLISNAESSGQQMVRDIRLGFDSNFDPATSMLSTANPVFTGVSNAVIDAARATYAVLTGRVTEVRSQAVLDGSGKYVELGPNTLPGGIKVYGAYAQDSWKVSPTLTVTGGLRYEVQTPFAPSTSVMSAVTLQSACGRAGLGAGDLYHKCNVLNPTAPLSNPMSQFIQLKKGTAGYDTDWNNLSPVVSVAWRPNVQSGFLKTLLGDPDQATLRAGYSVAYERQGLTRFTDLYGNNTGLIKDIRKTANSVPSIAGSEGWPVLLSQTSRLTPLTFDESPTYPIAIRANRSDRVDAFAPDIKVAKVQSWTVGFARSISRDTAVEIRYIGNYGDNEWEPINYNAIRVENLVANGFLNEFKLAMQNLQANNAAGGTRTGSFAYFGAGTGTNPLPIYLAYLAGRTDATNPAAYTTNVATTWQSSTLAGRLVGPNPNPATAAATDLDGNLTRRNQAAAAGYPANFFVLNPDVSSVNITDSGRYSNYHAMQLELRRRLSRGLSANVNYQYVARQGRAEFDGFSLGREMAQNTENFLRHAIKTQIDWTVPVGRGQRFGSAMHPVVDAIAGGWSLNLVGRVQARVVDLGNVNLVGISKKELQSVYKFYIKDNAATNVKEVWMMPDDIILNTRRAFSTLSTTVSGYGTALGAPEGRYIAPANSANCIQVKAGDCAPRQVLLQAPWFKRFDFGARKRFDIHGNNNIEVSFDILNVFDTPNYTPVANPGTSADIFRTTSAYTDPSNTYDPGGRIGQLSIRFNW